MRNKNGFGILEVLIAAMILVVVVGAAVALGHASLRSSALAAEKTTAYNLAQEGIELVRKIRDNSWVDDNTSTGWSNGLKVNNSEYGEYQLISAPVWHLESVTRGEFEKIKIGEPSIEYTRKVKIDNVNWYTAANLGLDSATFPNDPNKVIKKVTVIISWDSITGSRDLTAQTYLTDWKTY